MNSLKRQVLPGQLAVVATPIGNLEDLSPRARQVLQEVDAILCEDTRRTAKLIAGAGIERSLVGLERFDAHAREGKVDGLVRRLLEGESLALVTDAGTPGISDPGAVLVAAAHSAGVSVLGIPGPSAIAMLLSIAGFDETSFVFRGFFPRKNSEREKELRLGAACFEVARVWTWYESPERVAEAMRKVAEVVPEARVVAAKELTKLHEKVFTGGAEEVARSIAAEVDNSGSRGEWCFAILFPLPEKSVEVSSASPSSDNSSDWVKALVCLRDAGVSTSESVKHVTHQFGVPRNVTYETAVKIFQKKS